ncbi:hypothetical protein M9Y10_034458 [Tritrichomonas musculus]|uniref:Uncharacterized protein n=1 Tax=Tritrichomonas musculus TaxID=1915356 RepID=A0ABR2KF15_9EUKA
MGKAANGHGMNARRRKRYERLNPIYEERERQTALRLQHSIETQSGYTPNYEAPPVDQWQKQINVDKPKNFVHKADDVEEDVRRFKEANGIPY